MQRRRSMPTNAAGREKLTPARHLRHSVLALDSSRASRTGSAMISRCAPALIKVVR